MGQDGLLQGLMANPGGWLYYLCLAGVVLGLLLFSFRLFVALSSVFDYELTGPPALSGHDVSSQEFRQRSKYYIKSGKGEIDIDPHAEGVHLPCSYWEELGGRNYMEDRLAFGRLEGEGVSASMYAVFDGHGGPLASEFASQNMWKLLSANPEALMKSPRERLTEAFHQTEKQFLALAGGDALDGTTAVVSLVIGDRLFVANAGDSRALLVQKGARAIAMSEDHKPSVPEEQKRITDLGGKVIFWGRWRVEGVLAVSRAIGDAHLKPYVTCEPEVKEWRLTKDDCFLVLATDGIWDVLSNEFVAQAIMNTEDIKWVSKYLVETAIRNGSMDNVSVIVVDLRDHRVLAKSPSLSRSSSTSSAGGRGEGVSQAAREDR